MGGLVKAYLKEEEVELPSPFGKKVEIVAYLDPLCLEAVKRWFWHDKKPVRTQNKVYINGFNYSPVWLPQEK